jgi:DNA-binding NarL/FixJ family response regulator
VGTAIRNAMIRELKQSSIHAMEVRQSDLSLDQQNSNSLDGGRLALDDPYSWVVSESICEVVGEWADAGPSTRKKVLEHQIRGLTVTQSALEMGISHQAVSKHKRAINHFADSLR